MSENTDERMDRARRIRQMREGQREGADGDGDATDSSAAADAPRVTDADDADETGETDASTTTDESRHGTSDGATDDPSGDDATDRPAEEDHARDGSAGDDGDRATDDSIDEDDEAVAAAQRAAQAAAEVTGGSVAADAATQQEGTQTEAAPTPMQGPTGVELPDQADIEAAMGEAADAEAADAPATPAAPGVDDQTTTKTEETVRVLEFTLGGEHYCLDIDLVEEIVTRETITRVPNTPDSVEGVVDLRGQITTILDPKLLLDIDAAGPEQLVVVFDPEAFEDQGALGWLVDEVRQVVPIAESEINDPPVDDDYVEGVVDRDDDFVVWTNPEVAIRTVTDEDEDDGA